MTAAGAASPHSTWSQEARDNIAGMLHDGLSASQIGTYFGVSRNAIIGLVRRDKTLSEIGFARRPMPTNIAKTRKGKAANNLAWRMQRKAKLRIVKPAIEHATFAAVQTAGIPLMMLESHRCKWPVNDGSPFLFCGETKSADVPYCPFHSTLAYRPVGRVDERGTEPTQQAA